MFRLLVLLVAVAGISGMSDEMKELITNLHNTCVGEIGVDEGLVARAQKGDFADDEKLKCYIKCLMDQMACITEDGMIDVDAVVALLPPDQVAAQEPIIRSCGTQVGASTCENVWLTHQCYYKGNPQGYFLP